MEQHKNTEHKRESGQVSIGMMLGGLFTVAAAAAFLVFAEAADLKGSAHKGADAAALAGVEEARGTWLKLWLEAQTIDVPEQPTEPPKPEPKPTDAPTPTEPPKPPPLKFTYTAPDGLWAAAAPTGCPSAVAFAQKNDGSTVKSCASSGPRRLAVAVDTPRKQTASSPGKKFLPWMQAPADATAEAVTPPGLTCVPDPGGTLESWTLRCTSLRGSATAHYSYSVLTSWDKPAFERMFKIKLVK